MIAEPGVNRPQNNDAESVAWLLEKLAVEAGISLDRLHIRRVSKEAVDLSPGEARENWWKWVGEACRSLGLKCKVIDSTFAQCQQLLRDDAAAILCRDGQTWLGVSGCKRNKCLVLQPFANHERRWESWSHLSARLGISSKNDIVRCVVFEPQLTGTIQTSKQAESATPLGRVFWLLAAERGDIAVIVVFAIITGILALATPMAVEMLVNTVAFGRAAQPVVVLALMLLAFLVFSGSLRALQTFVVEMIQRRLFARVAADLSFRFPRVELEALDGQSGRELTNRFFDIVTIQKVLAQLLLDGVALILGTIIGMSVLAFYHPWLLGFDVVLLVMIAFILLVLGRGGIRTSIKESKAKYHMAAWLENLMSCPLAFRHGGAAEFALERSDLFIHEYLTSRRKHFRVLIRQIVFALGLQAIASTVLLGLGGWLVMTGQLTLGQLVAAELIVTVIVGSFAKLGKHVESYYDLIASVDKLGILLDLPIEHQDGILTFPGNSPAKMQLQNVCYSGHDGQESVTDIDALIGQGERVVVVGPDGIWKSHLLDLIFGTRAPTSGYLTIQDVDPRDVRPDALRRHVSLAREIETFDGTIAENIHLERPYVSTQEVRDALVRVGILEQVLALPEGLDTKLVETGYPLSQNQLRKLMIARAIVGKPCLLLIDGLLDALPDDDLAMISEILFSPTAPWTLVLVTGRQMLIDKADKTIEMTPAFLASEGEVHHG